MKAEQGEAEAWIKLNIDFSHGMRFMKSFCIGIFLFLVFDAKADLPTDPSEYAAWEQKTLDAIRSSRNLSDEEAFSKLGKWVYQMSLPYNKEREGGVVYESAKSELISRAGYGRYFRDLIEKIGDAEGTASNPYSSSERYWNFKTLQQLPSSETVKALGELLSDDRGGPKRPPQQGDDASPPAATSTYAAESLAVLVEPPYDPKRYSAISPEGVKIWKEWWAEVKSGKRIYRLKGSPIEYGPDGPVSAIELSRREHLRQSGSGRTPTSTPNQISTGAPEKITTSLWAKLAAGCAVFLLLIATWFAFGQRKMNVR